MPKRTGSLIIAVAVGAGALALPSVALAAPGIPAAAPVSASQVKAAVSTKIVDFNASPEDVVKGKTIEVAGQLLQEEGGSWKAYGGQEVTISFQEKGTDAYRHVFKVKTGGDGWFKAGVKAEATGWWRAEFLETTAAKGSVSSSDRIDIVTPPKVVYSRIVDFDARPGVVDKGETIHVRGALQIETDKGWDGYRGQKVVILFRADGSSRWEHVATDRTGWRGRFGTDVEAVTSGHWRAEFPGVKDVKGDSSHADHVTVREPEPEPERADSRVVKFNASPEPVRHGRYLKFTGKLQVRDDWGWDGHSAKVGLYFKPKGSHKWYYVKSAWSAESGKLSTGAKAYQSGYWKFVFKGDEDFYGDSSRSDYVRVKR
ncbi:hypothetical protein HS041_25010 [Planomonospora sp. ID67723]|uniref:hypothetical protein n=1 Tax=Planomonospora sp. ID67723 TaxID=2738134 RepID=UPI0018C3EE5C|nr:hypothetical protein [Planomonospora sp. ID67723]MBG0831024.1 hypothetical protein [Planomonospora sp. ID67723]